MTDDPFGPAPKRDTGCRECGGSDGAHYVWCSKLDKPVRRHR